MKIMQPHKDKTPGLSCVTWSSLYKVWNQMIEIKNASRLLPKCATDSYLVEACPPVIWYLTNWDSCDKFTDSSLWYFYSIVTHFQLHFNIKLTKQSHHLVAVLQLFDCTRSSLTDRVCLAVPEPRWDGFDWDLNQISLRQHAQEVIKPARENVNI